MKHVTLKLKLLLGRGAHKGKFGCTHRFLNNDRNAKRCILHVITK